MATSTLPSTTDTLSAMIALFTPYAEQIKADEMGDVTQAICETVIRNLNSAQADWLFENWDTVLEELLRL